MNVEDRDMRQHPSESVALEAERWLARLHSPACSSIDRQRFQDWLAEHPMHWQAYNQAEYLWAAGAQAQDPELVALADQVLRRVRRAGGAPQYRKRWLGLAAIVTAVATVAVVGLVWSGWLARQPMAVTYATAIGEIRAFTLADNSVITLDTDTVVQVRIARRERTVTLQRGQAQFKVAHDPRRPFIVGTPQAFVTAIGTVFQVRSTGATTEVTLLEGRVRVTQAPEAGAQGQELMPGDRLVARTGAAWLHSRADVAAANGWLSGHLVLDAMPLRQAVEEFNRYSQRKLRIGDQAIGDIAVEGVFNAGDVDSVVLALQYTYPLYADDRGSEIVLRQR